MSHRALDRTPSLSAVRAALPDIVLAVVLFLLALLLRLPYLHDVPRYTDEVREVQVALAIVRGESLPLTNWDGYIGALYNYLLAAAITLFGENPHIARLLVAISSAVTVTVTYFFGKEISGRVVGVIAGLLLAGNSQHIVNNAHIAYSHSLTPLATTLTAWILWRGTRQAQGQGHCRPDEGLSQPQLPHLSILAGALCLGLTVQTHPTAIAMLPGVALTLVHSARTYRWPRGKWFLLAVGPALLGYSNMIVYNLVSGGAGVAWGLTHRQSYLDGPPVGLETYPSLVATGVRTALSTLGASVWHEPALPWLVRDGLHLTTAGLVLAGAGLLASRRQLLIPLVLMGWVVTLPALTAYRTQWHRYWMPILPMMEIAAALALATVGRWAAARWRPWSVHLAVALIVVLLVAHSWPGLWHMYRARVQVRPSNAELERAAALIAGMAEPGELVLVDQRIFADRPPDETFEARTLHHLLMFHGLDTRVEQLDPARFVDILTSRPEQSFLAVLEARHSVPLHRVANVEAVYQELDRETGLPLLVLRSRSYVPTFGLQKRPSTEVDVVFGDQVRLLGYDVDQTRLACGAPVYLRLYWQAIKEMDKDYTIFVHVVDGAATAGDKKLGQYDGQPRDGRHPTSAWRPGEIVSDEYPLALSPPCDTGSVSANVYLGLYDLGSGKRLPVTLASIEAGQDYVVLPTRLGAGN